MAVLARGRIMMWDGIGLWLLKGETPSSDVEPHSHHALQITLSLEGAFELTTDSAAVRGPAAIVAPDVLHQFNGHGIVAFLFVEPESALGRSLATHLLGDAPLAAIDSASAASAIPALRDAFDDEADDRIERMARDCLIALSGTAMPRLPDERVATMIDFARRNLDLPISLQAAAAHVRLSAGRASHLFVEHSGLPFKSYVLWLRLRKAVEAYSGGANLTEAAHASGFSDSAHLSRTFKRMFGITAASLRVNRAA